MFSRTQPVPIPAVILTQVRCPQLKHGFSAAFEPEFLGPFDSAVVLLDCQFQCDIAISYHVGFGARSVLAPSRNTSYLDLPTRIKARARKSGWNFARREGCLSKSRAGIDIGYS
jgi:hypothetical protein